MKYISENYSDGQMRPDMQGWVDIVSYHVIVTGQQLLSLSFLYLSS